MHRHLGLLLLLALSSLSPLAVGGAQEPDALPPPRALETPPVLPQAFYPEILPYVGPQPPRPGTREVWQYMGVDQTGRWRPKVILSPYGSYYYYTREPYPWLSSRPWSYMPYATD
jgi:hypothetical protein